MISFKQFLEEGITRSDSQILHNQIKGHYNKYDDVDRHYLSNYTSSSTDTNHYLWRKHKRELSHIVYGYDDIQKHKGIVKKLDSTINLHKTPQAMTVYSGTPHDPRQMKDKNNIVHHPAYLSASLKENIGKRFARDNRGKYVDYNNLPDRPIEHLLKIHVPKDHPGAYIGFGQKGDLTYHPHEKEFILPRGTNLKYLHTESENMFKHTHHMEVVPNEES